MIYEQDNDNNSGSNWKRGMDRDEIMHVLHETGNYDAIDDSDISVDLSRKEVKDARKSWHKKKNRIKKL